MSKLKYTVIKNKEQYYSYCNILEKLDFSSKKDKNTNDEIELLLVLIEKWDAEHNTFDDLDPIELLASYMADRNMKAKNLVELLGVSKGYVSDILSYKKGLSKEVIRKLSKHFNVRQEGLNRPYDLSGTTITTKKKSSKVKTNRKLRVA